MASEQINNQSIQDMHIFGDPLHIPIVMVERCTSAPLCTTSGNLYFSQLDQRDKHGFLVRPSIKAVEKSIGASSQPAGHVLKIVVFVHGFQVCSIHFCMKELLIYLFWWL